MVSTLIVVTFANAVVVGHLGQKPLFIYTSSQCPSNWEGDHKDKIMEDIRGSWETTPAEDYRGTHQASTVVGQWAQHWITANINQ